MLTFNSDQEDQLRCGMKSCCAQNKCSRTDAHTYRGPRIHNSTLICLLKDYVLCWWPPFENLFRQTLACHIFSARVTLERKGHASRSTASTESRVWDLQRPLPYNTVITRSNLFKLKQRCSVIPPILISTLRYGCATINCWLN